MIEIKNLTKEYGEVVPFKDLSVTIQDGEVVSIIGPSGTGKSTLLRMINLLEKPTSGQVFIDGEEITAPGFPIHTIRGKVAMVFQSFNLFNHMTVIENVCYAPIELYHKKPSEAFDRGMELLQAIGLAGWAFNYPDQLSGGQKQRVAIARTLAIDPQVILMDEPTSALDPAMIGEVEKVIMNLCGKGYTMLVVTHDLKFAERISTRTLYLDQGGIYEDGPSEKIFHNPDKELTRAFIKQFKSIKCVLDSQGSDFMKFYSMLEKFSKDNDVPLEQQKVIQTVFEECCYQILLPKYEDREFSIEFSLDYSARDKDLTIQISYDHINLDMEDEQDALSWNIIKHYAGKIEIISGEDGRDMIKIEI